MQRGLCQSPLAIHGTLLAWFETSVHPEVFQVLFGGAHMLRKHGACSLIVPRPWSCTDPLRTGTRASVVGGVWPSPTAQQKQVCERESCPCLAYWKERRASSLAALGLNSSWVIGWSSLPPDAKGLPELPLGSPKTGGGQTRGLPQVGTAE